MQFFAVFLVLVAFVAVKADGKPSSTEDPYQLVDRNCAKQSGLTREQAVKIGAFEFPDEEEVHKYVLCGASKMGVSGDDEGSQKIIRVLNECVLESKDDDLTVHTRAYRVFLCMLKTEVADTMKKAIAAYTQIVNAEGH